MNDVLNVADAMLKIAKSHGKSLTPMQLMKLVYIAHGFSLAMRQRELFHNKIEAWQYGPVIPDLYHATKQHGRKLIPQSSVGPVDSISVSNDERRLLEEVYEKYGHLDGIQLSYLTHQSGTPWYEVYVPNVSRIPIENDCIQKHYQDLISARRQTS